MRMDYLASMYIDNEMDLGEKRRFVEMVHHDDAFYTLTVDLLDQEQRLRQMPALAPVPAVEQQWRPPLRHVLANLIRPFGFAVAGFAAAVLMVNTISFSPPPSPSSNRFVLFEPAADRVASSITFYGASMAVLFVFFLFERIVNGHRIVWMDGLAQVLKDALKARSERLTRPLVGPVVPIWRGD